MFSQQYGTVSRRPVHFYGNDGVCLFKYFVRNDDPRRGRQSTNFAGADITDQKGDAAVWSILALNLFCFIIITVCYIVIYAQIMLSSRASGQNNNPERVKENRKMYNKITVLVVTDFLCWVPFIFISALHNLGHIDATDWYVPFAMIVLPLNSVINPLIYDNDLKQFLVRKLGQVKAFIGLCSAMIVTSVRRMIPARTEDALGGSNEPETIAMRPL